MEAMDARTLESVAHTLDDRDEDAPDDPGHRELLPRETPLQRYDAASNKQAFLDTLRREDPALQVGHPRTQRPAVATHPVR